MSADENKMLADENKMLAGENTVSENKIPAGRRVQTLHPAGYLFFRVWPTSFPKPRG